MKARDHTPWQTTRIERVERTVAQEPGLRRKVAPRVPASVGRKGSAASVTASAGGQGAQGDRAQADDVPAEGGTRRGGRSVRSASTTLDTWITRISPACDDTLANGGRLSRVES